MPIRLSMAPLLYRPVLMNALPWMQPHLADWAHILQSLTGTMMEQLIC